MSGTGQASADIEMEIDSLKENLEAADDEDKKSIEKDIDEKEDQLSQQQSFEDGIGVGREIIEEGGDADDHDLEQK